MSQEELMNAIAEIEREIAILPEGTDMKDRGIKEIVKYGIAFAGKNVEIANG